MSAPQQISQIKVLPEPIAAETKISVDAIQDKISSLNFLQIAFIGSTIAGKVISHLGASQKYQITRQVMGERGDDPQFIMLRMLARQEIDGNSRFFSNSDMEDKFLEKLAESFLQDLQIAFKTPINFLDKGLSWKLSDYEPEPRFEELAKGVGLVLNMTRIPRRYCVYFELNQELTQKSSELTFTVTERSAGVEFSKSTFSLKELEDGLSRKR